MTTKKTLNARNAARAGNWATYDFIERRAATKKFVEFAERIARDKDAARAIVQSAGIITKTGRLTKRYRHK